MGVFVHTLIIIMPGLNVRGLQSKLLITPLILPLSVFEAHGPLLRPVNEANLTLAAVEGQVSPDYQGH